MHGVNVLLLREGSFRNVGALLVIGAHSNGRQSPRIRRIFVNTVSSVINFFFQQMADELIVEDQDVVIYTVYSISITYIPSRISNKCDRIGRSRAMSRCHAKLPPPSQNIERFIIFDLSV